MPTLTETTTIAPARGYTATKEQLLKRLHAHCVIGAHADDQADKTDELMAAVARLPRRG